MCTLFIKPLVRASLLGAAIGTGIGFGLAKFIYRGPLPIVDDGFQIFATSRADAMDALVMSLSHCDFKPSRRIDSADIKRVLVGRSIVLNYTSPTLFEKIGRPACAIALKVSNPLEAAQQAVGKLQVRGFSARILEVTDPDVPEGAMVFVATDALENGMLVFRKHVIKMGPPPPKWKPSK